MKILFGCADLQETPPEELSQGISSAGIEIAACVPPRGILTPALWGLAERSNSYLSGDT